MLAENPPSHLPGEPASGPLASSRSLRVLVVEDDPATLVLMLELLRLKGHWGAGVSTAESARDRFMDGAFDVLITDVELPALSGIDLVEMLHAQHRVAVIFISAHPRREHPVTDALWIEKPFGMQQLNAALETILAREAAQTQMQVAATALAAGRGPLLASDPLENRRDSLPAADAHRDQRVTAANAMQFGDRLGRDDRPGRTDRMAK